MKRDTLMKYFIIYYLQIEKYIISKVEIVTKNYLAQRTSSTCINDMGVSGVLF